MDYKMFFDGASKGNPGHSGGGFVIYDKHNNEVLRGYNYCGITTNNVAEYHGLIYGLSKFRDNIFKNGYKLEVYGDSKLVIMQAQCIWRAKKPHLQKFVVHVNELLGDLGNVDFYHISRDKNTRADELSNLAVKSKSHKVW